MKKLIKQYKVQRLLRYIRPLTPARPRWKKILSNQKLPQVNLPGRKVLLVTSTGSHWAMAGFESVLATALRLRDASVEVLLCDGVLPVCQECDIRLFPEKKILASGAQPLCGSCFSPAKKMFSELDIVVNKYSDYLSEDDKAEIESLIETIPDSGLSQFSWRGVGVGEHALAGALRFFGCAEIDSEQIGYAVLRQYLKSALITASVMLHFFAKRQFDVAVFHHGIYVPQGIVGEVCRLKGIAIVNWHPAYRNKSYLFTHHDSYHKVMIDEPVTDWQEIDFDHAKEQQLMQYLSSRRSGVNDWISFQHKEKNNSIKEHFPGLDLDKPTIGLLTNVMWDAQLHFEHNAFPSMLSWLFYTVEFFIDHPDLQLMIRIHPAEVLGTVPSRQRVDDELRKRFGKLPSNIFLISADSPINTYELMNACDSVLVYGTKMSIELPCWGKSVVVAGEAWARGKGFTTDVNSVEEYGKVLTKISSHKPMTQDEILRARKYAFHFFCRRMIPVKFASKCPYLVPYSYTISSLEVLKPGADLGLDTICEGILTGRPFIYENWS